jgi:hypothetical protein
MTDQSEGSGNACRPHKKYIILQDKNEEQEQDDYVLS